MSVQAAGRHEMDLRGRAKEIVVALRGDLVIVSVAARAPDVPVLAKLCAIAVAAYAVSPIDLIPDVIPVIGLLDDLVVLPLGIGATLRLIPEPLRQNLRHRVQTSGPAGLPQLGAMLVVVSWLAVLLVTAVLVEMAI